MNKVEKKKLTPFKKGKSIVEIAKRHHLPEGLTYDELREYLKQLIIKIDRIKRNARERLNELRIKERNGYPVNQQEIKELVGMIKGLKYEREELIIVLSKVNRKLKYTRRKLNGVTTLSFFGEFHRIAKERLPADIYNVIKEDAMKQLKEKEEMINEVVSYPELQRFKG